MEEDELTPDEFRVAMDTGIAASINSGSRPLLVSGGYVGAQLVVGRGGGVAAGQSVVVSSSGGTVPVSVG